MIHLRIRAIVSGALARNSGVNQRFEGRVHGGYRPARSCVTHALADCAAFGGAAIMRRMKYRQGREPIGIIEREAPRDHAAEREPDHRRALDAASVHEPEQLAGEHGEVGRARRWGAFSMPEQIVGQHAEMRRECWALPLPHGTVKPEAVDQDDRRPASVQLPYRIARASDAHPRLPLTNHAKHPARVAGGHMRRYANAGITSLMNSSSDRFCSFIPRPKLA